MHGFVVLLLLVLVPADLPSTCAAGALARDAVIRPVGAFTNMRYTEEHSYGYSVHLWRSGECLFGLFMASDGLAGDTPAGVLENVRYDPVTGYLLFRARLTQGEFSDREHNRVASRDVFEFSGTLTRGAIRGSLLHSNALTPARRPIPEKVALQKSSGDAQGMITAKTFAEWEQKVVEILRFRGPRW